MVMRDDLTDIKTLRQAAPAAITSLTAWGSNGVLAARADGVLELLADLCGEGHALSALSSIHAGQMGPALLVLRSGVADYVLLCTGHDRVWLWERDGLRQGVASRQCRRGLEDGGGCAAEPAKRDEFHAPVQCSMCAWEGPRGEGAHVVTSSIAHAAVLWWSMGDDSELRLDGADEAPGAPGGVTSLSGLLGLVVSCHADGSLVQWHGLTRTCIRRVQSGTVCLCSLAMAGHRAVLAQAFAGRGKGGHSSIHFAAFDHLHQEEDAHTRKEPKKEKAARVFAHKSRGGRKNFESKQTGRHTSLSKCTR